MVSDNEYISLLIIFESEMLFVEQVILIINQHDIHSVLIENRILGELIYRILYFQVILLIERIYKENQIVVISDH